jgi:hypothetical protein
MQNWAIVKAHPTRTSTLLLYNLEERRQNQVHASGLMIILSADILIAGLLARKVERDA